VSDAPPGEAAKPPARPRAFPWVTGQITLAAIVIFYSQTADAFIYDRVQILHGQLWRIWTGHVVHFGFSHMFWNLAVFLPAGCWLESIRPNVARCFYALGPLLITSVLLAFDPTLLRYAGLSGVATGLLVLLACSQLQLGRSEPRWFWIGVLALVGLKIGLELFTGKPLLVSDFKNIRDVPLAHLGGAGCAVLVWAATRQGWAQCHR
jgi:rhomboid family GlyGly-CTERM serine protease